MLVERTCHHVCVFDRSTYKETACDQKSHLILVQRKQLRHGRAVGLGYYRRWLEKGSLDRARGSTPRRACLPPWRRTMELGLRVIRSAEEREELQASVGELPEAGPQERQHHSTRGEHHTRTACPVGKQVVRHCSKPAGEDRQRDQELLEDPFQEGQHPEEESREGESQTPREAATRAAEAEAAAGGGRRHGGDVDDGASGGGCHASGRGAGDGLRASRWRLPGIHERRGWLVGVPVEP